MAKKKIKALTRIPEKKKHASKEKLKEVNEFARKRLAELGVMKAPEESVVDEIRKEEGAPMLPGLREYLPTPLLINFGRRTLLDFGREWILKNKSHAFTAEKFDEFFKFIIKRLKEEDSFVNKLFKERAEEINKLLEENEALLEEKTIADWLKPHDLVDMMRGVSVFIVDSCAVAVATHHTDSTSEFLEWFLSWTTQLLSYWPEHLRTHGAFVNLPKNEQVGEV